jgi:hypothetical protein
MSEGHAGWICAECKASSTETLEERADRFERLAKELRQEIRKRASEPDPTDIRKSVHAKRALKGVNEWAGAYSKTLGKDGMMVFRGVLHDVVEDLKVVATALRGHFGETGGSFLFGRKDEEIMFAPLYETTCQKLSTDVTIQWDRSLCRKGLNAVLLKDKAYDSLVRVAKKLVSVLGSKDGKGDKVPVELMDIGFKIIRGHRTREAFAARNRALELNARGKRPAKSRQPLAGAKIPRTGLRQLLHADGQDFLVAEAIVPLSEVFGGVELYGSAPRDTNRMGIASRRAMCAFRLAGARILQRDPEAAIGIGIQGRGEVFTWGDLILLDASQPHQGPGLATEDRLGLYCNIGTPNKDQKIFGGRYITDLGVYSDHWNMDPKSWVFGSAEWGVRTSLQQAADEHPPTARWLSEVWLVVGGLVSFRTSE